MQNLQNTNFPFYFNLSNSGSDCQDRRTISECLWSNFQQQQGSEAVLARARLYLVPVRSSCRRPVDAVVLDIRSVNKPIESGLKRWQYVLRQAAAILYGFVHSSFDQWLHIYSDSGAKCWQNFLRFLIRIRSCLPILAWSFRLYLASCLYVHIRSFCEADIKRQPKFWLHEDPGA